MPLWVSGIWRAKPRARAGRGSRALCLLAGTLSLASCAGVDNARSASPSARQVREAVRRGVAFLEHEQLLSGEFPVFVRWEKRDRPRGGAPVWTYDGSVWGTSQVLYSLQFVPQELVADLTTKAAAFVLGEMEAPGVWRYYT